MLIAFQLLAWLGHAHACTTILNMVYSRPVSKAILRPFRVLVGLLVFALPAALYFGLPWSDHYYWVLAIFACHGIYYIIDNLRRQFRKPPPALRSESTESADLWQHLGRECLGDGKMRWAARLPFTCAFRLDRTDAELQLERLPREWDGLTVLVLSDFHFHGTPSKLWFERVIEKVREWPVPDVVCLGGDFIDSLPHRDWIAPLLGQLKWKEHGLAVLGNHDVTRGPESTRQELLKLNYHVLSNTSKIVPIRGLPCALIGHEGPWFPGQPDLSAIPDELFKLCVSHTPDNFPWAIKNGIDLTIAGHVHGGQVRLPFIGSMFVPSLYGRAYDQGFFQNGRSVLTVTRGLSGKEPLRVRCHPQALRLTLRCR
jgi:uncharacterized protein